VAHGADGCRGEGIPGSVSLTDIAELYAQYHGSLVRLLYRRTGDRDRAEDLAQDVFVRALEAPPLNPKPWLFAVALNLARDDGRRTATRARKLELLKAETAGAAAPPADQEVEGREKVVAVSAALAQLSETDREALLLKAEGFSYEEIASALGLAKGAIGTTLARARRRLVDAYRTLETRGHVAR
jgi:RNA polymerase sigma-70 factor (ECF subfamily)